MQTLNKALPLAAAICATVLLASPDAQAKIYAGASLGQASADFGAADVADGSMLSSIRIDDSDSGEKLYAGISFFKFVALEVGLVDLGEFSVSATSDGTGGSYAAGAVDALAAVDGILVSAVGRLPLGKFTLFAKTGYYSWDADLSVTNGGATLAMSEDGTDIAYGAGISYRFGLSFSIRLEYEIFDIDGTDVDFASAGVAFRW